LGAVLLPNGYFVMVCGLVASTRSSRGLVQ
jgi:hypothetical protein